MHASVFAYLVCPASHYVNVFVSTSTCVHVNVCQRDPPLGRPWTSPFIDTRGWSSCTYGGVAMC